MYISEYKTCFASKTILLFVCMVFVLGSVIQQSQVQADDQIKNTTTLNNSTNDTTTPLEKPKINGSINYASADIKIVSRDNIVADPRYPPIRTDRVIKLDVVDPNYDKNSTKSPESLNATIESTKLYPTGSALRNGIGMALPVMTVLSMIMIL